MGPGMNRSNPIECTSLILPLPRIFCAVNQRRGGRGALNEQGWPEDSADVPLIHLKDSLPVESQLNTFSVIFGGLNLSIACPIQVCWRSFVVLRLKPTSQSKTSTSKAASKVATSTLLCRCLTHVDQRTFKDVLRLHLVCICSHEVRDRFATVKPGLDVARWNHT